MLPPELTRARKREGKLTVSQLSAAERARATEIGLALLSITQASLGQPREELQACWAAVPAAPKERKLLLGLTHLLERHSEFVAPAQAEPEAVRRAVFGRAAQRRAALPDGAHLDRRSVLEELAVELGVSTTELDAALYADLKSAQRLQSCSVTSAAALVTEYELLQVQSVLVRAVRVEAEVRAVRPEAYRELFRKLKFRQLLFRIEPLEPSGYRLEIDGPLSLFGPTTKYGLELSLSLPALLACGQLRLKAELCWGKRREKLRFEQSYGPSEQPHGREIFEATTARTEVQELLEDLALARGGWQARPCEELIDLTERGGGVLVPDLELSHPEHPEKVLVELLGFWSRDAVFRRIEAAEGGLSRKVLFVVSSRLRVSEELLDGIEAASLYVYKGKVNASALLRKIEGLARFGAPA
jgi:predicted nuclease of restriction endonuclease-like RecB superfamily